MLVNEIHAAAARALHTYYGVLEIPHNWFNTHFSLILSLRLTLYLGQPKQPKEIYKILQQLNHNV